jgi:DNA uptake protein ComE-like DNA-binding protein
MNSGWSFEECEGLREVHDLLVLFAIGTIACVGCSPSKTNLHQRNASAAAIENANRSPNHPCLNLNSATLEQLTELPGIGQVLGRRIIEYRDRNGPFRRPQEVIIIEGFSERKYNGIADRICVE